MMGYQHCPVRAVMDKSDVVKEKTLEDAMVCAVLQLPVLTLILNIHHFTNLVRNSHC